MSIEEKRREVFEEWAVSTDRAYRTILSGHVVFRDDGEYGLWAAWNAALDSVAIQSPGDMHGQDTEGSAAWNAACRSWEMNIIEAGLKVNS